MPAGKQMLMKFSSSFRICLVLVSFIIDGEQYPTPTMYHRRGSRFHPWSADSRQKHGRGGGGAKLLSSLQLGRRPERITGKRPNTEPRPHLHVPAEHTQQCSSPISKPIKHPHQHLAIIQMQFMIGLHTLFPFKAFSVNTSSCKTSLDFTK